MRPTEAFHFHSSQSKTIPFIDCSSISYHGFKDADLDRTLNLLGTSTGGNSGYLDILGSTRPNITLRQVIANLKKAYCSSLGVEYMHIPSQEKCNWIRDQVENPKWMQFTKVKKTTSFQLP